MAKYYSEPRRDTSTSTLTDETPKYQKAAQRKKVAKGCPALDGDDLDGTLGRWVVMLCDLLKINLEDELNPIRAHEGKLREEVCEFIESSDKLEALSEGADVIIVVLTALAMYGYDASSIFEAVEKKLQKNLARTWVVSDDGILNHI